MLVLHSGRTDASNFPCGQMLFFIFDGWEEKAINRIIPQLTWDDQIAGFAIKFG